MQITPPRPTLARRSPVWAFALVLFAALQACAIPISYYDSTTYENLVSLKVDCVDVVASMETDAQASPERATEVHVALKKAWEYEKGKGQANSDTARQFKKVVELFEDDLLTAGYAIHPAIEVDAEEDDDDGALGSAYWSQAADALTNAFDIVIATENLKNSDKD